MASVPKPGWENYTNISWILKYSVGHFTWSVPAVSAIVTQGGPLHVELGVWAGPDPGPVQVQVHWHWGRGGGGGGEVLIILGDCGQKLGQMCIVQLIFVTLSICRLPNWDLTWVVMTKHVLRGNNAILFVCLQETHVNLSELESQLWWKINI